ncbi:MAG: ABC transporter permease [Rhodobacteraceae bacterium]|jgi:peptide/nickel transport system permease protein|nr:ABC transporter permease [Paracoccaceae bacterium]
MQALANLGGRLLSALVLIGCVIVFNFLLINIAPGDPATVIAGEMGGASEQVLAEIRAAYGLDQPMLVRLGTYVMRIATGDLGYSYYYNDPVADLILSRLGPTLLLLITGLGIAIVLGVWLGVLSALRPDSPFSHLVTVFSLIGYSAPVFWTGLLLIILFGSAWPIFPIGGIRDVTQSGGPLFHVFDVAHHLVLPALTLGAVYTAQYARLCRASMLEVLKSDYVRTARAKGLRTSVIVGKHALRNAILPVVTIIGLQIGQMLSGAVLVETVFNWPGLGTLAFESVLRRDYPTLLGILVCSTVLVVIVNMLTELAYRLIDPRIRAAGGAG